ncbi:CRISPR-associated protein Cas4 [Archaeoglobus neptunius]|uniref:CRISPR-associated protein Cas4 n=1 Tax=Archaeoglobus neptunius TaxID=2798580 RepID=UPI00192618B6|nr:CRISPR-associated protein Cas4 [Archaeoglobus neptunius]
MIDEMYIRGVEVNYYFVCKTKLWLFSHNVSLEKESDLVKLGKLVHKEFYRKDRKDVRIGPIAIDVVRKGNELEIQEVKKAKSMEKADLFQMLYYLFYLSNLGIPARGRITYPKSREVVNVELDEKRLRDLEEILREIDGLKRGKMPKPVRKKHCRKCAYFEFCFAG